MDLRWMDDAQCYGLDTAAWFPEYGGRSSESAKQAIAICNTCPARDACERYAIDKKIEDGIWGGRTARDRRKRPYVLADRDEPLVDYDDVMLG